MKFNRGTFLEKVVISHSARGGDRKKLELAKKAMGEIFNRIPFPVITSTNARDFKISRGKEVGAALTFRGPKAIEQFKNLIGIKKGVIFEHQITSSTVSFGVPNHLVFPDQAYDPEVGVLGFYITATFSKPGIRTYRIRSGRKLKKSPKLLVSNEEVKSFVSSHFEAEIISLGR